YSSGDVSLHVPSHKGYAEMTVGTLEQLPGHERQSRRLWSLWEMFNLKLKPFLDAQDVIVYGHAYISRMREDVVPDETRHSIARQLRPLIDQLQGISDFDLCRTACESLARILTTQNGKNQIVGDLHYVRRALLDQGGLTSLAMFSASERDLISPPAPLFGPEVEAKFPDMGEDISESGKCLGYGLPTATVFHLMRVMERGLQRFGNEIGVTLANEKNWQNVLNEANKVIKALDHKLPRTKALAEAASHLYAVKVAWRNEVMHPKQTYTMEQAREIFDNCRAFIRDLAGLI
ncbi:MAG: hypothetical protein KDE14_02095, partial [Rhodobacteraceae bacterium]|nr:hypothetical protein [Paracoccaceae bacterium]